MNNFFINFLINLNFNNNNNFNFFTFNASIAYFHNLAHLIVSVLLLLTGLIGIIKNKNNILLIFIFLEVSLLSINLIFIFGSILFNNDVGLIIAIFILTLSACESCIGLAILISFFKLKGSVNTIKLNSLIG